MTRTAASPKPAVPDPRKRLAITAPVSLHAPASTRLASQQASSSATAHRTSAVDSTCDCRRPARFRPLRSAAASCLILVVNASAALAQNPTPAPNVRAEEPFFSWMVRASGPIGLVILLLSFYLVALVVWMALRLRREEILPDALTGELTDLLAKRQFDKAFARLNESNSFLARVLNAGVRKLPTGREAALRAMELVNDDLAMEFEHRTTYLATVGTLGPMIGLLGTVYGMILSFRVIATAGSSPEAGQLAAGISTALFATLEGIALSVPAIASYAYFRNRIARRSLEVAMTAEGLLDAFAAGIRPPHPLATAAASPPPPPTRPALPREPTPTRPDPNT